jgi:hypothetical protein
MLLNDATILPLAALLRPRPRPSPCRFQSSRNRSSSSSRKYIAASSAITDFTVASPNRSGPKALRVEMMRTPAAATDVRIAARLDALEAEPRQPGRARAFDPGRPAGTISGSFVR